MTEVRVPVRRDVPSAWVRIQKEHLLRELGVDEAAPRRSGRRLAVAAAAVVTAALLSLPALGVGTPIVSLFAGWRDPGAPVPVASDVLVASGRAGVPWKIVATPSDQGLCLGLFHRAGADELGSATCGFTDIRGDLPRDIRGDPRAKCIATPTTLAPCRSLPRHWIDLGGAGTSVGLERTFAFGPLAEDVASVDLVLADGQRVRAHVAQPNGLPLKFFWAAWPCPLRAVSTGPYAGEGLRECAEEGAAGVKLAIVRDASGRVLERRVPAWNRNPLGDPGRPR
jgi:hypothetical protein